MSVKATFLPAIRLVDQIFNKDSANNLHYCFFKLNHQWLLDISNKGTVMRNAFPCLDVDTTKKHLCSLNGMSGCKLNIKPQM